MGYPQPEADKYVQSGFEFFRLFTTLGSDGDIYESAQGAQAFALGPNSDISRVNLGYQDPNATTSGRLVKAQISPQRAFTGLVNAPNGQGNYLPAQRPGKILLWPDELYNADWVPSFIEAGWRLDIVPPVLDVIQYFKAPDPTLDPQRSDKTYHFQRLPFPADDTKGWVLAIPFYGRRYMSLKIKNVRTQSVILDIYGVSFALAGSDSGSDVHMERALLSAAPILAASGGQAAIDYRASIGMRVSGVAPAAQPVIGTWDYLMFTFSQGAAGNGQTPLRIAVSDTEP